MKSWTETYIAKKIVPHTEFIIAHYDTMSVLDLAKELEVHYSALSTYCHSTLGLKKQVRVPWTELEVAFLQLQYKRIGDKELAKTFTSLGYPRNFKSIYKKRLLLGLHRSDKMLHNIKERQKRQGVFICNLTHEQKQLKSKSAATKMKENWRKDKYRMDMGMRPHTGLVTRRYGKKRMFTEDNIRFIRESGLSQEELAEKFRWTKSHIGHIKLGHIYRWVTPSKNPNIAPPTTIEYKSNFLNS